MAYGSVTLNLGTGGDALAVDTVASKQYQLVKLATGGEGVVNEVSSSAPLNVILGANSGVDIGDVDVLSLPALSAGGNTIGTVNLGTIAGIATETTLVAQSAKLPASLGAKTSAASMSMVLASDHANVTVDGTVTANIGTIAGIATETTLGAVKTAVEGTLTVSGTVTANAGTNLNTSLLATSAKQLLDGHNVTVDNASIAVTVASLPLPSGAATSAAQLADGHNVTVDNASIAITAASLPLPTGAATSAAQLADGHNVTVDNASITIDHSQLDLIHSEDYDTDAGTDNTAAMGLVVPSTTGPVAITGDAANGLDVDVTRVSGTVTVDGSGFTQPVSGTITANAGTDLNTSALALSVTQTDGNQKSQIVGGGGNVCDIAEEGVTANTTVFKGPVLMVEASISPPTPANGAVAPLAMSTTGRLFCDVSGSSLPMKALVDDVAPASTGEGSSGNVRMNPTGDLHVNMRNQAGDEVGTASDPVRVDPTGTTAQPSSQSGTWNITNISGTVSLPTDAATQTTLATIDTSLNNIEAAVSGSEMQVDVVAALPAGTNAIGKLAANSGVDIGDVDVTSQPARVATTDTITAKLATDVIQNGTTALTPKFVIIDAATNGDNELIALSAGKKLRVLAYTLVASAAVNAQFESSTAGNFITGSMNFAANGGVSAAFCPVGHFETVSGESLNLILSAAVSVDGHITYVEV